MEEQDFIVSELLSELKRENERKDKQIKSLHKAFLTNIIISITAILVVVGVCFWYLNQYDFSASDTLNVEKSAEGVYAMIDSDGNVVGYDMPVTDDGESDVQNDEN